MAGLITNVGGLDGLLSSNASLDVKLTSTDKLTATLGDTASLDCTLNGLGTLNASLTDQKSLKGVLTVPAFIDAPDIYDGAYEVNSFVADPLLTTSLVLPTNKKLMKDDVTIYSVPTTEEYNEAGGVTFTIGE